MTKKSQKRNVPHGRDQSGCMWALISMFDFRHDRSTQKLLSDRRSASRHVGSGNLKGNTEMLPNLYGNCLDNIDGEETIRAATGIYKPSVKKLIEEEMITDQDAQKEPKTAEAELKQSVIEHGSNNRKIHKNMNRSRSQSCDIDLGYLKVDKNLPSELPCVQNSDKQCKYGVAIDEMMEELCRQIQQKSSYVKCDQCGEVHSCLNWKNPEFEEKLSQAINHFVSQKLINEKNVPDAGDDHSSKELRDALQILISDEEMFLKLLQGPKSVMLKHVQNLCNDYAERDIDTQVSKEKESKSLVGSNLSEGKLFGLRQSEGIVHSKQYKFFRRRCKSLEEIPSREFNTSETSNTIIILKPGPTVMPNSENDSSVGPSPQSDFIMRSKGPNDRVSSYFSLTEIKRKLKNAMGTERQEASSKTTSKRLFSGLQATRDGDKGSKEVVGRNSPSKDHFFVEKIARPPIGVKKGQKHGKLKESETVTKHDTATYTNQRLSNIYIEAKKHLSEMLSNGNGDVDCSSRQTPKPLGKILSFPDCNASPIPSPGRNWGQSLAVAEMRFSVNEKFQKKECNASHLSPIMLNSDTQSDILDGSTDSNAQSPLNPNSSDSCELLGIEGVDTVCSREGAISEVNLEIAKSAETVLQEESNISDPSSGSSSQMCASCTTRLEQSGDLAELCSERGCNESLIHDNCKGNQEPSSPLLSPSTSPVTKNVECLDCVSETPDRRSPVSVLEPLFPEDDISPGTIKSQPVSHFPVKLPMQPQRIQFEEYEPSAADESIPLKMCVQDKELIFEYVKEVLQVSGMNWDVFNKKSYTSEQLLDPSILNAVEYFPNQLCHEKELLFDCINEVLIEILDHYSGGCPGLLFVKSTIRPVPDIKNAICEIWEGVCWHLLPLPLPHTLDQIVHKDMAKSGTWMDLQSDTQVMVVEIVEDILEDLIHETLF